MRVPSVRIVPEYVPLRGGLDLVSSGSDLASGSLITCQNYESAINGGYEMFLGYERFDGRPRPSDAEYVAVACTFSTVPTLGDILAIGAASVRFIKVVTGGMLAEVVSGTIPPSTTITRSAVSVGTTAATTSLVYVSDIATEAINYADAGDARRLAIASPPGTGAIRGVAYYKNVVYCWRDNGGVGVMYRSTATGWAAVALAEQISFTNAGAAGIGATLTQGGVTATVAKVMLLTGSFASGTNTGRLVITGRTGGNFAAGAASAGAALTLAGIQTAQAFPAGGKYTTFTHNFFGGASTENLYGANGVGPVFEFDGTTVAFLVNPDLSAPSLVEEHLGYLMSAQDARITASSAGNPYRHVAAEGAAIFGVGATVTNMRSLPGQALGIMTPSTTRALKGKSSTDWIIDTISEETGGYAWTLQILGQALALDSAGVVRVNPVQEYGDFEANTISRLVQPFINSVRGLAVASCVVRSRNLYRIFMNDGRVLSLYNEPRRLEFTSLLLDIVANVVTSQRGTDGVERVFIGATNGMVYEMDRPSSFDGAEFQRALRIWYASSRRSSFIQRYRKLNLELSPVLATNLGVQVDFVGLKNESPGAVIQTFASARGQGALWDDAAAVWDLYYWDAGDDAFPDIDITGSGTSMAFTLFGEDRTDRGHTVSGLHLQKSPRRLER